MPEPKLNFNIYTLYEEHVSQSAVAEVENAIWRKDQQWMTKNMLMQETNSYGVNSLGVKTAWILKYGTHTQIFLLK